MIFLINVIISCGYLYITRNVKKVSLLYFFPIIFLWTFILGFQYDVGTDYFSYLNIYNSEGELNRYFHKGEFLFFYFISFLKIFSKNGQIFFVFLSLFESIFFYHYVKLMIENNLINKKKLSLYIFLFLCFGTNFYNQMNVIRQYFNIYLLSISTFYIYNRNIFKYIIVFLFGVNIHRSFLLMIPFYLFRYILKFLNSKTLRFLIFVAFLLNFLPIIEILKNIFLHIPQYSHYVESSYLKELGMAQKITKFIYLPYYLSVCSLVKKQGNSIKQFMLKIGLVSYIIKIFCLKLSVTNRIGEYFTLLAIYPIYLLLEKYIKKKDYINLAILLSIIIGLFVIKVIIFPKGEYLYRSYLFN